MQTRTETAQGSASGTRLETDSLGTIEILIEADGTLTVDGEAF